jgi:hypothetical protein
MAYGRSNGTEENILLRLPIGLFGSPLEHYTLHTIRYDAIKHQSYSMQCVMLGLYFSQLKCQYNVSKKHTVINSTISYTEHNALRSFGHF